MTSPDVPGLQRLKQRTGNVLWLHNSGTRCIFGVPPARQIFLVRLCPRPEGLLLFCYFFAIFLLFQGPLSLSVALLLLSFCYFFATFLLSDCYPSLFALHKQGTLAMYTSPRRKGSPSESRSSLRADHPRLNPTPLAINPAMPDGLANASRPHSKLRTRSPLSGWFMMAFRALAGF